MRCPCASTAMPRIAIHEGFFESCVRRERPYSVNECGGIITGHQPTVRSVKSRVLGLGIKVGHRVIAKRQSDEITATAVTSMAGVFPVFLATTFIDVNAKSPV